MLGVFFIYIYKEIVLKLALYRPRNKIRILCITRKVRIKCNLRPERPFQSDRIDIVFSQCEASRLVNLIQKYIRASESLHFEYRTRYRTIYSYSIILWMWNICTTGLSLSLFCATPTLHA